MAYTSYKTRVIYKLHNASAANHIPGTYKLMLAGKQVPSPSSPPNTVEATTFEDSVQRFEMGVKQSDSKEFVGNLEKEYLDDLIEIEGQRIDIIQLYGTDGVGGAAKSAYYGQVSPTINDVSDIDSIVEMTATVVPNGVPEWITDDYTVTDNGDGTFTVAASSSVTPEVILNRSNMSLSVGQTGRLYATTRPIGESVTYTSSDTEKATVNSTGVVTGVAAGTSTITAKITVNGTNYTDSCVVTVS